MFVANAIIGGQPVDAGPGRSFERRDLMSGRVVTRAAALSSAQAEQAADAAARAFADWSGRAPAERAVLLRRAADSLSDAADTLARIGAAEVGVSAEWVRINVAIARETLFHAASLSGRIGETVTRGEGGLTHRLIRKPAGVVLGIAPWNAAITLAVRAVAAPLALGNTVVLKGSELCPKLHETVTRALIAAGLPEGALNYVSTAPEDAHDVVEAMIAHPAVRRVNFTGSTRVGREIALMTARHLKKCLLELSGKASAIVLSDADLPAAARAVAHGAFLNQGQICMSTDRVVVEQSVANAFIALLVAEVQALRFDPATGHAPLGQMIGSEAVLRVRGLIEDAEAKGALLLTGGETLGALVQPAILDHVAYGMRIYGEEVFGPALGVIRVADADEAVTVANDSEFGLAAAVFGADLDRASAVARQIECGAVHVNGSTVRDDPAMPYGGVKASGYGRFGGEAVVEEFTEFQWMTVRAQPDRPGPGRAGD